MTQIKNRTDINELSEKILKGTRKALCELVKDAALKNEDLIVGDKTGNFDSVPARILIKKLKVSE